MTTNGNQSKRVAILLEDKFEDSEFQIPYTALKGAGVTVTILGARMNDEYQGKRGEVLAKPDATATEVRSEDFDAIVIPGGMAPDRIRANPNAVRLVMDAMAQNKIVAAVCHGTQVLIEADQLRGKQATGYQSIRKDMQNAGATYINEPVVVQGNLITSRRPSDLPVFTTTLLTRLGLSLAPTEMPDITDQTYEWWKLGEAWGGSTRLDIVNAINTALTGEHYTLKAFEQYVERASDQELKVVLAEVRKTKHQHVQLLEQRLAAFNEQPSWQTIGSEAYATLQGWLQSNEDEMAILRRAIGDVQTGVVDAYRLCTQLTDPITVEIMEQIESNLARHEERLGDLYRARMGSAVQPPMPTTFSVFG